MASTHSDSVSTADDNNPAHPICASCGGAGNSACKGCLLVTYCNRNCQTAHWTVHKTACKSVLNKASWQPRWVVENRVPTFMGPGGQVKHGGSKYLWGNVPAIDVLKLEVNEGNDYEKDLNLLFAASGDLRNVVQTIANIPKGHGGKLSMTLNDQDSTVVARNAILLLVALVYEDQDAAMDCMIHVWYSAFIRRDHADSLAHHVRPLIEDVNTKIMHKPAGAVLGKTWQFSQRTLRLVLTKEGWKTLLSYLQFSDNLSAEEANDIRTAVTLAPSRIDNRERSMLTERPAYRVCKNRFREDGMLLPFGHAREPFSTPNPTLFEGKDWPLKDSSDPLAGWPLSHVLNVDLAPASNDLYGKLYFHVKQKLSMFQQFLSDHAVSFRLFNVDAATLPAHPEIQPSSFARVEVSNISDMAYLGIHRTIGHLAPFMQQPQDNPHATLITLFVNAVPEMHYRTRDREEMAVELRRLVPLLGHTSPTSKLSAENILKVAALPNVRDGDKYFKAYMSEMEFPEIETRLHVAMKEPHTIIEKWPMRFMMQSDQKGAKEEFKKQLASGHVGMERYVEWKRTA